MRQVTHDDDVQTSLTQTWSYGASSAAIMKAESRSNMGLKPDTQSISYFII